jgi:hypothetical protein
MKALHDEREALRRQLEQARQKAAGHAERFVGIVQTVQTQLKALAQEAQAGRNKVRELLGHISLFGKKLSLVDGSAAASLQSLKTELLDVYKALQARKVLDAGRIEDATDELRRLQLAKEEEVGRALMLEEQISRLEHEAAGSLKKIQQVRRGRESACVVRTRQSSLCAHLSLFPRGSRRRWRRTATTS